MVAWIFLLKASSLKAIIFVSALNAVDRVMEMSKILAALKGFFVRVYWVMEVRVSIKFTITSFIIVF